MDNALIGLLEIVAIMISTAAFFIWIMDRWG